MWNCLLFGDCSNCSASCTPLLENITFLYSFQMEPLFLNSYLKYIVVGFEVIGMPFCLTYESVNTKPIITGNLTLWVHWEFCFILPLFVFIDFFFFCSLIGRCRCYSFYTNSELFTVNWLKMSRKEMRTQLLCIHTSVPVLLSDLRIWKIIQLLI